MTSTYSKNAILVGPVDFFCLACDTYLMSEKDSDAHITKPVHQKHLEAIQYDEEFKADCIKKIKTKYFCELCNRLLPVQGRVRLHILEQMHIMNKKKIHAFKRVGTYIIAFDKIALSDQSWNGLNQKSCAICNTSYENEETHRNQSAHIINIIQIHVEFDSNQNIYRKIDDEVVHCLICNMLANVTTLADHFIEEQHKKFYQLCCDAYKKIVVDTKTNKIPYITSNEPKLLNEMVTIKSEPKTNDLNHPKQNQASEDPNNDEGNMKKGSAPEINKEMSEDIIKTTEKINTASKYVYDKNDEHTICKSLGCENYITVDELNHTWCILCDWVMSPENVSKHVNGKHHQTIHKLHKERLLKMSAGKTHGHFNKITINNVEKKHNEKDITHNDKSKIDSDDILEKCSEFRNEKIDVNFVSNCAYCRKCSVNVEFCYKAIKDHISEHNRKPVKEDKSKMKHENVSTCVKVSATQQNILTGPAFNTDVDKNKTSNNSTKKGENYCSETTKPSDEVSSRDNKESVTNNLEPKSRVHTVKSTKKPKAKSVELQKMPLDSFIQSIKFMSHEDNYMTFNDLIINEKYCINYYCFAVLVQLGPRLLSCLFCKVNFPLDQCNEHINLKSHWDSMPTMQMIIYDPSEFIREIPPGSSSSSSFHCGFCNTVETSWESMKEHLTSFSHKECKNFATWRRGLYRDSLQNQTCEKVVSGDIVEAMKNELYNLSSIVKLK